MENLENHKMFQGMEIKSPKEKNNIIIGLWSSSNNNDNNYIIAIYIYENKNSYLCAKYFACMIFI